MASLRRNKLPRSRVLTTPNRFLSTAAPAQSPPGTDEKRDSDALTIAECDNRSFLQRISLSWWISLLLAVLTFAAFWPVLRSGFINLDDPHYVTANPHVLGGLKWENVTWAFRTGHASNWHPLTWISHQLDAQLFGLKPGWHHFTNLLFHVVNSLLLFGLLQRLTQAPWRSGLVAALFALHPLHVESVAWVAERKDVLSAFFFMLTLLAYTNYVKRKAPKAKALSRASEVTTASNARSLVGFSSTALFWYLLSLALFALGLMSKPMLVTLPFVLLLLDFWPLGRIQIHNPSFKAISLLPLIWEKLPFFLLSAASSLITFLVQDQGHAVSVGVPLEPRLANALAAYLKYLAKAVWPTHLAIFYPHPNLASPEVVAWDGQAVAAALMLLVVSGCALLRLKREPWLVTGWFWFVGMLVPVIGVVQVGGQSMADRYTYLPLIGIFVIVSWAVADFAMGSRARRAVASAAAAIVVLVCATVTNQQVKHWHSNRTLFEHALSVTKGNAIAHCNLGADFALRGKFDEAIPHFREALAEAPTLAEAHVELAAVLDAQGKREEALEHLREAVRVRPWNPVAHNYLGIVLQRQGKREEARNEFAQAAALDPDFPNAHVNLGNCLATAGQFNEAAAEFRLALHCDPRSDGAHFGLGSTLSSLGKRQDAIIEYQTALQLNPTNSAALNDLAWLRATAPEESLRDGTEAVKLAQRSCELTEYKQAQRIGTLAAAYAEAGRFQDAVKSAEKAKELALAAGDKSIAERNEQLLGYYRANKPYHEPSVHH